MTGHIFWNKLKESLNDLPILQLNQEQIKNTTLCIIDINNGFAKKGALYSDRVEKNIANTAKLAKDFLTLGAEVLAYTDCHNPKAKEFKAYPPHCIKGTEESKLVKELEELKDKGLKEIPKNSTNGILAFNPATDNKGKDYLVIGCVTDICVYQFAITLRAYLNQHDLAGEVYLAKDLVDTFDIEGIHPADFYNQVFLKSMIDNGINIYSKVIIEEQE